VKKVLDVFDGMLLYARVDRDRESEQLTEIVTVRMSSRLRVRLEEYVTAYNVRQPGRLSLSRLIVFACRKLIEPDATEDRP
jgi:hypothetical protein